MFKGLRSAFYAADDVGAARDWYAQILGFPAYFDQPFYVGFDVAGYELGISPRRPELDVVGGGNASWAVDDVPAALTTLIEAGATVHEEATDVGDGIVVGAVRDPFGNVISLICNPHFAPPVTHAKAGDGTSRSIQLSTSVALKPDDAWALWTTSEGLASWWLPDSRVELRPGGFFELYFMTDAPRGTQGSDGCRILSFLPGKMLSFTWNAPPAFDYTRPRHTWVVLLFEPEGQGTKVLLNHLGWPESEWDDQPQWAETFAYFEDAWDKVLKAFTQAS